MTRSVPPYPPAPAEWLLAGLTDRALSHRVRAPPLDGERRGDGDADTGTHTTIPDDGSEDIASLTSQQSTSPQLSNF